MNKKISIKRAFLGLIVFWLAGSVSFAEVEIVQKEGEIFFEAIGKPSMIKIRGVGKPKTVFKLNTNLISGEVEVPVESLRTGIHLRDEHLKHRYLKMEEYPFIRLTFQEIRADEGFHISKSLKETKFQGTLVLRGKSRQIEGVFDLESEILKAHFELKLTDFEIEIPSYLGITVADKVKVMAQLKLSQLGTVSKNSPDALQR